MDDLVRQIAHLIATGCNIAALGTIAAGAAAAVVRSFWSWRRYTELGFKKDVWIKFASTLILALEFALSADIANTAVAPSWQDIGQLAAIAAIRTLLSYSLGRDLEAYSQTGPREQPAPES